MPNHVSCQGSDSHARVLPIPVQVSGREGPQGRLDGRISSSSPSAALLDCVDSVPASRECCRLGEKYWLLQWNRKGKLQRSQQCLPRILNHGVIHQVCKKVATLPRLSPRHVALSIQMESPVRSAGEAPAPDN